MHMKSFSFMLVLFAAVTAARAEDITLTDGRTLRDATIISQAPMHITVRHSGGLMQVAKNILPEHLRTTYPPDKAAAERERILFEARRATATAEREAQAKLILERSEADVASREADALLAKKAGASALATARDRAERGADKHFRTQWKPGNNEVFIDDCRLRINIIEPKPGEASEWKFSGEAWVNYYLALSKGQKGSRRVEFDGEINKEGVITITEKGS